MADLPGIQILHFSDLDYLDSDPPENVIGFIKTAFDDRIPEL